MRILRGVVPALVVVTLVTAACGGDPEVTAPPSATPSPTPTPTPAITEIPFAAAAFPATGSACDAEGYAGRLGRVEAVERPDRPVRAVRARRRVPRPPRAPRRRRPRRDVVREPRARTPMSAPTLAGTGTVRRRPLGARRERRSWRAPGRTATPRRRQPGHGRAPGTPMPPPGPPPSRTRRSTASTRRGRAELDQIATLPELVVTDRGGPRDRVPRRSARGLRSRAPRSGGRSPGRSTAARSSPPRFPPGRSVPSHLTPCIVAGACGGPGWYEFNAPAGAAALATAGFDLDADLPAPRPGRPGARACRTRPAPRRP